MAMNQWAGSAEVDRAARACMKGKRARPDAIAFRARYGEEVLALTRRLAAGEYHPKPGIVFVTERPKHREVHAAAFRDRVVHHLLHALLEPRFEKQFIADSFACRRGKGTVARRRGDPALFARVPPHKRLGRVAADRGLPIGNLTSQFFANVYIVRPGYMLPRRRVVRHLEARLREAERVLAPRLVPAGERVRVPGIGPISGPCLGQPVDHRAIEALRSMWGSYEGHLRQADTRRLRTRLIGRYAYLRRWLSPRGDRLKRRFLLPRPSPSLAAQVQRLRKGLDGAVLLLRVGAYAECARWQDARALGLRLGPRGRGRRRAGVPWRMVSGLIRRGLLRGLRVAVAFEEPFASGNVKTRRLAYCFEPALAPEKAALRPGDIDSSRKVEGGA